MTLSFAQGDTPLTAGFAAAAERLQRSTVQVRMPETGAFRGGGVGSGVVWPGTLHSRPIVITSAHVARTDRLTLGLSDDRELAADVVARDATLDLAALAVEGSDLPAAEIGDSDDLRVGQLLLAVGNPLGLTGALTTGILHAFAPSPERGRRWVQADIRLAPGNSGGPLADAAGRVIGINAMISGGIGLAVPSNTVQRFLSRYESRHQLGVMLQPVRVPVGPSGATAGLLLIEVAPGSIAKAAGLLVGDVIVAINGMYHAHPRGLAGGLQNALLAPVMHLDLLRGGTLITRDILFDHPAPGEAAA